MLAQTRSVLDLPQGAAEQEPTSNLLAPHSTELVEEITLVQSWIASVLLL